ncbi:MAG: hypothetical protein ACR2FM_05580 [Candidatus Saccharimonadales bacterium]
MNNSHEHNRVASAADVQGFYDLSAGRDDAQFKHLLIGEKEAMLAMAVTMATGRNLALVGEPAIGKTTIGQDAGRIIDGLDKLTIIPERADLKVSQLLGGEVQQVRVIDAGTPKERREVNRYETKPILTPDTQMIWSDEFNHLQPTLTNSLSEALEARRFKNPEGSIALNGLEYVVVAQNPGKINNGQFKVKPSVATRFGVGVIMGIDQDPQKRRDRIGKIGYDDWKPQPQKMQAVTDLEELHAIRNFINGNNIVRPESLRNTFIDRVDATEKVLREYGLGESTNRIALQVGANAKAIAAFWGEPSLTPESIDQAVRFVVGARIGMLSVNAVQDYPEAVNKILS